MVPKALVASSPMVQECKVPGPKSVNIMNISEVSDTPTMPDYPKSDIMQTDIFSRKRQNTVDSGLKICPFSTVSIISRPP